VKKHFALLTGVSVLCFAGWVIGVDPPMTHHNSSTSSHSSHTLHHERVEMERREHAWRDWYYRTHRRYIRPGYGYPGDYPPGYTDTDPNPTSTQTTSYTPGQNGTDTGTPQTTSPIRPPAATDGSSVSSTPDAPSTPPPVDPDLQTDLDRVKKACAARADYVAAVADKKDAEEKLAELHRNETGTPEITSPLATRILNAKRLMATIEREETARTAKLLEAQAPAPPAASATR
jgi:hypothetical protein